MDVNIKYCKFKKNAYKDIDGMPSHILKKLIELYPAVVSVPENLYDINGKICEGKLKKYLCVEFKYFVDSNYCFSNAKRHNRLYITKTQLRKATHKNPTKISIYVGVFVYFLIRNILLAANGKDKFIKNNNILSLDLNQKSGNYVMQRSYEALLRILPGIQSDASIINENVIVANYIIDCFGSIDDVYKNVSGWVNNPMPEVEFNPPYGNI